MEAPSPARGAGIGLRDPHVEEILASRPAVGWLEVHAENYMGGGPTVRVLEHLRLRYKASTIPEVEFLNALVRRTGCGLLCDVNNVYVTCQNVGGDAAAYLDAVDPDAVCEMHLAGHAVNDADGHPILIDDHGSPVVEAVWRLYRRALDRFGTVPTLIEWDTDLPPLTRLLDEAATAGRLLRAAESQASAVQFA